MPAEILERGKRVHRVEHKLFFERLDDEGAGYAFDSDEQGNLTRSPVDENGDPAIWLSSYLHCRESDEYHPPYVTTHKWSYWDPTLIRCICGRKLSLPDPLTNECECGRLYNSMGQSLKPRSMWGEDCQEDFYYQEF